MKTLQEMTDEERLSFTALAILVAQEIKADNEIEAFMSPAMTALMIKGWERSLLNVWAEYSIDRELFLDDAIQQTAMFLHNLVQLLHDPGANANFIRAGHEAKDIEKVVGEAETRCALAVELVRTPPYRPIVNRVFKQMFEQAKSMGRL